jgi:hypothetical protein
LSPVRGVRSLAPDGAFLKPISVPTAYARSHGLRRGLLSFAVKAQFDTDDCTTASLELLLCFPFTVTAKSTLPEAGMLGTVT